MREIAEFRQIILPTGRMLQIDRVLDMQDDAIVCEQDLHENWVFPLHFPGDPIFPGSLLIEAAGQVMAIWAWEKGLRGDPRLARVTAVFESPVVPADRVITYHGLVRRRRNVCMGAVEVKVGDRRVAIIQASLAVVPGRIESFPGVTAP
jgi:3-hydroxymyristoyl/3-hydroxydecanoyl-(acyl carrier protein) dehydratase